MRLHFVGIGGSGISGVASLALEFGHEVTGCDLEDATAYGKNISKGHSVDHLEGIDLLIVSPATYYQNTDNPELKEGIKRGIVMTWQEFLGKTLLKDKKVICVAGTHGKSTTTAMAGKLLIDAGLDPIVMVGAYVPEWNGNARFGRGDYAVIEADEFNNNFLSYKPEIAIINNIEFDHPDFFKDEEDVLKSFDKFRENLVGRKLVIAEKDGLNKKFNLKILGLHNQKNANMVFLLGKALGIAEDKIVTSIESFSGVGRRLELIATRSGIKVYDDYAHHPTAVKATLEAVRKEYPTASILVVDEPHGYKRTKSLLANYKGVFNSADKVIIGPIYKARDEVDESITPEIVAKISEHTNANGFNSFEEIISNFKQTASLRGQISNFDVIVVMGAGKSYLWAREIVKLLPVKFSDLTTFKIGGPITNYYEVKNKEEVIETVKPANAKKQPIFIIGGGSDVLVSDQAFLGTVIKYVGNSISLVDEILTVEAGLGWDKLVDFSIRNNLQGLECLSGIPGTVGGAPIQNIGAYGQELKNTFVSLEAYDIANEKFVTFNTEECKFAYRDSIFKTPEYWQKFIVVSITLKLSKIAKPEIKYDSLIGYLKENNMVNPTLADVRAAVLEIRKGKFENPEEVGNAGSFFKNPILDQNSFDMLVSKYPNVKYFAQNGEYKVFSAWLIENAGWKGKLYKSAGVSPRHALILINPKGDARAKDVYDLSERIINDVKDKFDVNLEREVQLINF